MRGLRYRIQRFLFAAMLFCQDLALLVASFWLAFWLRFGVNVIGLPGGADTPAYWIALLISAYVVMAQLLAAGHYSPDYLRTWREDFYDIARAISAAGLLLFSISFFYRRVEFSRQTVPTAWALAILALNAGRLLAHGCVAALRRRGFLLRRALMVGRGSMLPVILEKMRSPNPLGLVVAGIVDSEGPSEAERHGLPYFGSREAIAGVLEKENIQLAFCVDSGPDHEGLLSLIEACEEAGVEVLFIPQVHDLLIDYSGLRELDGLPMIDLREEPISSLSRLMKRCVDITLGSVLLMATFPVQALIALAIRLDSPGPAIFAQSRVGYRGRRFRMLKFRSMVADAESRLGSVVDIEGLKEPVFKLKDDPRVTRIGRWLRRTSLDELPQLFNVVLGQMSLVGPRPEEEALVDRYNVWQRRRLKVKPGITGLQQIKCRGSTSLSERVKYDIYYIRKMNLLLDLEIMFRTIWVVIDAKGAH